MSKKNTMIIADKIIGWALTRATKNLSVEGREHPFRERNAILPEDLAAAIQGAEKIFQEFLDMEPGFLDTPATCGWKRGRTVAP